MNKRSNGGQLGGHISEGDCKLAEELEAAEQLIAACLSTQQ
jgi:hypothetical protein